MEIPLIDASSIFARLRAPGLIAIAIAACFAFVSLARRTAHLVFKHARGISAISNQTASALYGEWSDTESEPESDSESDTSAFSDEGTEIDEMETHGDDSGDGKYRDSQGQDGNFNAPWGGAVVRTWEGLGLFGSGSIRSATMEGDADTDITEMPVVRYWNDNAVRPKWRRRRSFVMMDLW